MLGSPRKPRCYSQAAVRLLAVDQGEIASRDDLLAAEEPLEIRVTGGPPVLTMRTPGHDLELAAGLLLSEAVIKHRDDIVALDYLAGRSDVVKVVLRPRARSRAVWLERSSLSNSACGVCGKTKLNLETLIEFPTLPAGSMIDADTLLRLPQRLRNAQGVFKYTGGLHATALFSKTGELRAIREDVGRHNAMDKLCGWAVLNERLPLHDHVVLLSGRASFELLQKAIMARAPVVCAISAPSSFAVRLARDFGVTLIGFLRDQRFNVYSRPERIRGLESKEIGRTPDFHDEDLEPGGIKDGRTARA